MYGDISDGRLHKSIRKNVGAAWSVTLTLNTDGSPVFSSSKASVWPTQLMVNELPFNVRFQNVIVGALWFAKTHPPFHLFVKAFVTALKNMGPITWHYGDECVKSSVYVTCCGVDSPARASLLNMNHHGGYFSCLWCLQKGAPVDGEFGK